MILLPPKYADRIQEDPKAGRYNVWANGGQTFYLGSTPDQAGAVKLLEAFDRSLQAKRKLVDGFNYQEQTAEKGYEKQAEAEHAERVEARLEEAARHA